MAAINHGGTFYRLDKSSQSDNCGETNVMALHLASKQVMPFAFAFKGIWNEAGLKSPAVHYTTEEHSMLSGQCLTISDAVSFAL